jgi:quinol monooxygenase YgiN
MVRLVVDLHAASPRDAIEVLEALRALTPPTRLERGCQECTAWTDRNFTVHYSERWSTETDVRRRVRSPGFISLLAVMECARAPVHIQFDFVTMTRGIDYVEEVRAGIGD